MHRSFFTTLFLLSILVFPQTLFAIVMPKDVPINSYYHVPVRTAIDKGVLKETQYFYPSKPLTRAQFVHWFVRSLDVERTSPATASFFDVPKSYWAYASIETAKKLELVSGTQTSSGKPTGKFEPNALVNRAQAAVIIMKAFIHLKDVNFSFPDLGKVPWAQDAIKRATTAGFFSGYSDGTFGPANSILRAEGITVFMKIASKIELKQLSPVFVSSPSPTSSPPSSLAPAPEYTMAELLKRINAALPRYTAVNVKQVDYFVIFFGFDPELNGPYTWYRFPLSNAGFKPEVLFGSLLNQLFQAAVSPDGKEFLAIAPDGKVTVTNTLTLAKTDLGTYTTNDGLNRYSDPVYSQDGRYIIFFDKTVKNLQFDPVSNGLLVIDAATKNIKGGTFVLGFSMNEGGGGELESGITYTKYTFLDPNRIKFNGKVLNLTTMSRE